MESKCYGVFKKLTKGKLLTNKTHDTFFGDVMFQKLKDVKNFCQNLLCSTYIFRHKFSAFRSDVMTSFFVF